MKKPIRNMKRGDILLIIFLLAVILVLGYAINKDSSATSKATDQGSVSVEVQPYCGDGSCNNGETCSSCSADCGTCPSPPGGGGGGPTGGAAAPEIKFFSVDKELIKAVMRVGETLKVSLKIKNEYKNPLYFTLDTEMTEFMVLSQNNFTLASKNEKEIFITFFTSSKTEPGVYTGKLKVKGGGVTKEIPVILEIESKEVLFDVSLNIPITYKQVYPGEFVVLQFTIFNLGKLGKVDVVVDYFIKDFDGNTIMSDQDTISVEEQISFSRTLRLPYDLDPGTYVATAQVKYDYFVGTSSDIFEVERRKGFIPYYLLLAALIFLLALIIRKLIKVFREYRKEKAGEAGT